MILKQHDSLKSVTSYTRNMGDRIKEIAAGTRQLDERETKVKLELDHQEKEPL